MNLWREEEWAPLLAGSLKGHGHIFPAICQEKTGKYLQALATAILSWHSGAGHQIKLAELESCG